MCRKIFGVTQIYDVFVSEDIGDWTVCHKDIQFPCVEFGIHNVSELIAGKLVLHQNKNFHGKFNSTFYGIIGYGGIIDGSFPMKDKFEFHMECTIIWALFLAS